MTRVEKLFDSCYCQTMIIPAINPDYGDEKEFKIDASN